MTTTGTRLASLLAVLVVSTAGTVSAQAVRVTVPEENFRKTPEASNNRLATVLEGATLEVEDRQGRWVLGALEGWIWGESVQATDRDGFDLVVSKTGGENLRRSPDADAPRNAVLMQGMLLDSLDARGGWFQVRRTAWIWSASTAGTASDTATAESESDDVEAPEPTSLPERLVVGSEEAGLLISPEGDTAAVLRSGTDIEVLAREAGWTRVRLEGWVWEPSTLPPDSAESAFDVADLRANPERFRGRRIEWTVRFVALQRAEAIRTDFYEGEHYFLANPPGRTRDLIYVAVPPELLPTVQELRDLQTIEIVARVRTGRSQTGVPIFDLIALR